MITAGIGIALPLWGVLFLTGVIDDATHASAYYQPSLEPTVLMALFGRAAASALRPRIWLVGITIFGTIRFCARALVQFSAISALGTRRRRAALALLVGRIAWLSFHRYLIEGGNTLRWLAGGLAVTAAVLTADLLTGRRQNQQARRIDWLGVSALLAGLAVYYRDILLHADLSMNTDLLPSYGVAFAVCLFGGIAQRTRSPI
jgi:hypothetical protein